MQEYLDSIPSLTSETLDTLEKKTPKFFAYLTGDQSIPEESKYVSKGRGRPKKYVPIPVGKTVHKIELDKSIHVETPLKIRAEMIEEFEAIGFAFHPISGIIEPDHIKNSVQFLATQHNLSYKQAYEILEDTINSL